MPGVQSFTVRVSLCVGAPLKRGVMSQSPRGNHMSFWQNWSDGKKWWMGIASALIIASVIALVTQLRLKNNSLPEIPGNTGWIFAGYYDADRNAFTEGPTYPSSRLQDGRSGNTSRLAMSFGSQLHVQSSWWILRAKRKASPRISFLQITKGYKDGYLDYHESADSRDRRGFSRYDRYTPTQKLIDLWNETR